MSAAAKRYALALFQLAQEKGQVEPWGRDLDKVRAVLAQDGVLPFLKHPALPAEAKRQFMQQAFSGLAAEVRNVMLLLADHSRLAEAEAVIDEYQRLLRDSKGVLTGTVQTAQALSDAEQEALAKALATSLGREVALVFEANEALIGGVRVQIGDRVYDGSLAGQLGRLKSALHRR